MNKKKIELSGVVEILGALGAILGAISTIKDNIPQKDKNNNNDNNDNDNDNDDNERDYFLDDDTNVFKDEMEL